MVSCGDGKDQRPLGERAHWVGVTVVGHCCAYDDGVSRDADSDAIGGSRM